MTDVVYRFADLFDGRRDAFGTDSGGCFRPPDNVPNWEGWCQAHLAGEFPLGVYPMVPVTDRPSDYTPIAWMVKWGCVDLDVKGPTHKTGYDTFLDAAHAVHNLRQALMAFKIVGWPERTRSGGYHVWVFAEQWVAAATMRRALLVACEIAGVPPSEVNPKSEGFESPDTLGNYVRLPYPGGERPILADMRIEQFPGEDSPGVQWRALEIGNFLTWAEASLAPTDALAAAAQLHVPPTPHHERTMGFTGEVVLDESLKKRLGGLAFTILRDGPREGGDRSGALFTLARKCCDDGLTLDEGLAVVTAADLAWGKYHLRHDGDRYLRTTLERAYV